MPTKHCNKCNTTLDTTEFGVNNTRSDGLQSQCKNCRRITNNEHYKNSPARRASIRRNQKKVSIKIKEYLDNIKKAGCSICNEKEPCTLDFHHLRDKKFNIGSKTYTTSLKNIIEEVKKCVLICSNCHRKIHAGKIIGPVA